jgi:hypothetical protein
LCHVVELVAWELELPTRHLQQINIVKLARWVHPSQNKLTLQMLYIKAWTVVRHKNVALIEHGPRGLDHFLMCVVVLTVEVDFLLVVPFAGEA